MPCSDIAQEGMARAGTMEGVLKTLPCCLLPVPPPLLDSPLVIPTVDAAEGVSAAPVQRLNNVPRLSG